MLTIVRSRRIPALLTSTSRAPYSSIAWRTIRCAPSQSATSSVLTIASPPAARISSTTSWAGPRSGRLQSSDPTRLLTTTRAPSCANSRAYSRPSPRPAPVMIATRPSRLGMRFSPGRPEARVEQTVHCSCCLRLVTLPLDYRSSIYHHSSMAGRKTTKPMPAASMYLLLALLGGENHGYALMRLVDEQSGGVVRMGPGTLYGTLNRLL